MVVEVGNLVLDPNSLMPSGTVLYSSNIAVSLPQIDISVIHSVVIGELQLNLKQANLNNSSLVPHDQIIPIRQMILLLNLLSTDNHPLPPLLISRLSRPWRRHSDGGVVLLVASACILHIRVFNLLQVLVSKECSSLLSRDGLGRHVLELGLGRWLDLLLQFGARLDVPLKEGLVFVKD